MKQNKKFFLHALFSVIEDDKINIFLHEYS